MISYEEVNRILNKKIDKVKETVKPKAVKLIESFLYEALTEIEELWLND